LTELTVVVEDHLLLRILLDDEPADLRRSGARLVATGLWYHRLCRAMAIPTLVGSLSRRIGEPTPRSAPPPSEPSRRYRRSSGSSHYVTWPGRWPACSTRA
jgi:hypothetical protein